MISISKLWEKLKNHFHEVMKSHTSEHSIALGFAVGTFISIIPTPGINLLLGLLIVLIFEKVNKLSLFASLALWNPLTTFPIYYLSFKISGLFFDTLPAVDYKATTIDIIYSLSRRFLIGNIILAFVISTISYFLVIKVVRWYRRKYA